jgi:hypothetical protein
MDLSLSMRYTKHEFIRQQSIGPVQDFELGMSVRRKCLGNACRASLVDSFRTDKSHPEGKRVECGR